MRTGPACFAAAALVLLVDGAALARQAPRQPPGSVCASGPGAQPRLLPRDEASERPDFLQFRQRLQAIAERRDAGALLEIVDPAVRVTFGDDAGVEAFRTHHVNNPERDFWAEFAEVLRLGGVFITGTTFVAPYTFAAWLDEFDAFSCVVVIGEGVRLRAAPSLSAPTIAMLTHAVVEYVPLERDPNWERVRLADGRIGFIASRYVRSPVDLRAFFEFKDGRWWLTAYVAGD
jgi:hypothetical protein